MAALEALYRQDPSWIWLVVGCLFVAFNLAAGAAALVWPAIVAALLAAVELAGLRPGHFVDVGAFVLLSLASIGGQAIMGRRIAATSGAPGGETRSARLGEASAIDPGGPGHTARLIGRIGRTSSAFVNGVGRVWIDGAEWGAEIAVGEGDLDQGVPVRVVKVIGGIRLQVHALETP